MAHATTFETFTPSVEETLYYLKQWVRNEQEVLNKRELDLLFLAGNDFSSNEILEQKITMLKRIYKSRIGHHALIIQTIQNHKELQKEISNGNLSIVNTLSSEIQVANIYPFLTKFFHHHNPTAYPFYSNNVANMLYYLDQRDHFYNKRVSRSLMASYENFYDVMESFKRHYNLNDCSFLYLDILLNGSYNEFK